MSCECFGPRLAYVLLPAFILIAVAAAFGQNPPAKPAASDDDVIRIDSSLVQTDVMVYDKNGKFVDGLKQEDFSLKVNGQPRRLPFFERVGAGTVRDSRLAGSASPGREASTADPGTRTGRGRTIVFFVDDLHLSQASLLPTRKSLMEFLDKSMLPNDQVAITSTSGQIGFLQQFTDDRFVLREAVAKLSFRATMPTDTNRPPMSEYLAAQINNGDAQATEYYAAQMLQDSSVKLKDGVLHLLDPQSATKMVQNRAREVSAQAAPSTEDTLRMLEGLMRTVSQIPGRKLVFMISDGFLLTDHRTSSPDKIRKITDAAGKAGVVIYTIDARGLVNEGVDATGQRLMDVNAMLSTSTIGELSASQDGMNALARDTGGRPYRNTNVPMAELVQKALEETSLYYLLAWQPDSDEEKSRKFKKIELSIIGRPDLTVRVRNGYFMTEPLKLKGIAKKSKDPVKAREDEIRGMIDTALPQNQIPTVVGVTVIPVLTNSSRLTASIKIDRAYLAFDGVPPALAADMDIGAIFYNRKGKPVDSFVGRIRVLPVTEAASEREKAGTIYVHDAWLAPGLYQVRVAVRDVKTGRVGTAMQWIQVSKM